MYLVAINPTGPMYYIVFAFFYLFSLLPFWVLYPVADLIYFVLYRLTGYRKEVVLKNLKQAFPEKTPAERKKIAKAFYHNLADQIIETIKMMSISRRQIEKRYHCDPKDFDFLEKENHSCQIQMGHVFNWEWANLATSLQFSRDFLVIYKPIKSKIFNRLMKYMRSRFGAVLISSKNLLREMRPYKDKPYTSVLVADQNPSSTHRVTWHPFLNKMTAFYRGPEISARRGNLTILFGHIFKVKRGHYKIITKIFHTHPQSTEEGEIMGAFAEFLEENIRKQPEGWLWSHKRWKREWKGEQNK